MASCRLRLRLWLPLCRFLVGGSPMMRMVLLWGEWKYLNHVFSETCGCYKIRYQTHR